MYEKRSRLISSPLIVAMMVISGNAFSDGYRNPPPTAEGIGKAGVNSVFVDDASAISYNPANLASQTNRSVVVAVTLARTDNEYSPIPGVSLNSDGDWNVLPDLYYSQSVGDSGIAFGLGITSPYGQGISWNKTSFAPPPASTNTIPYKAALMLADIRPTVAFSLGESLCIGGGLDIVYSKLKLSTVNSFGLPVTFDSKMEGDGWGVGGNVGLTWKMTEKQRMTATYKSRVDVDYKGDFSLGGDFKTTIAFPNSYGLGYGVQMTDDIRVEALLEWLQWSVNDVQTVEAGGISSSQANNWDDTFTIGVGGDWQIDENWVVRAGYAFIETPIPASTLTPLLPDADRHALSLGMGYTTGGHTLDLAYTFSIYEDRVGTNPQAPGRYEIESDLVGLTYSYSF